MVGFLWGILGKHCKVGASGKEGFLWFTEGVDERLNTHFFWVFVVVVDWLDVAEVVAVVVESTVWLLLVVVVEASV